MNYNLYNDWANKIRCHVPNTLEEDYPGLLSVSGWIPKRKTHHQPLFCFVLFCDSNPPKWMEFDVDTVNELKTKTKNPELSWRLVLL